jgi:hypothetical protein
MKTELNSVQTLILLFLFLSTLPVLSQSPEKLSYQAIVRNSNGNLVTNQGIGVKISILKGSDPGTLVYQEIYNPNPETNANGLITLIIGGGIPLLGTFSSIDWSNGLYFLQTEIDPTGATNYTITGTSQFLSVPYSYHASKAESVPWSGVTGIPADIADGDQDTKYTASTGLNLAGTTLSIANGGVGTNQLANNAVTSAKIQNGSVGAAQLEDVSRTISFPAHSLNYDHTSTIISSYSTGLRWKPSFASNSILCIAKPSDWDGSSNVLFRVHFYSLSSAAGNVDFFIRARAYNPGDTWADASSVSTTPVANTAANRVGEQVFTIPSNRFGTKGLWVITLQNQSSGSTYPDDVVVTAVSLTYNAVR